MFRGRRGTYTDAEARDAQKVNRPAGSDRVDSPPLVGESECTKLVQGGLGEQNAKNKMHPLAVFMRTTMPRLGDTFTTYVWS